MASPGDPRPAPPVSAALFQGSAGAGARRAHALLSQIVQVLAPDEKGVNAEDTGVSEAAEIAFGPSPRARRTNAAHPGIPFLGAWRDLPQQVAAHVLLGTPPQGGMITALPAAAVPETAHGRISLRAEARRAVAALGDDPAPLFGDAP